MHRAFDRGLLQGSKTCPQCGKKFTAADLPIAAAFKKQKLCTAACMHAAKRFTPEKVVAVFWSRVNKTPTCWLWTGAKTSAGYGDLVVVGRKHVLAHRFAWALQNGEIPKGLLALHKCDTPLCVRPDHLFLGTDADNMADAIAKGRSNRITRAKLTEDQVRAIRLDWTGKNADELAARYQIAPSTIYCAATRRSWAHIK